MSASLTDKQAAFVAEFLVDLNATQAAIRAGYSAKTARAIGAENLTKPDIAEAIGAAKAERARRTGIRQDRVLLELARLAYSDIRKAVDWNEKGVRLVAASAIDDDTAAAIASVVQTKEGIALKFHDKTGALDKLCKHLGVYASEKVETKIEDVTPRTPEDMAKAFLLLTERLVG